MSRILVFAGNSNQVIYPNATEAELNAAAEVPMANGESRSVGVVVPANRALIDNTVKLSKNMKLRMKHKGFEEKAESWKTSPTWDVTVDPSGLEYGAFSPAEDRPTNTYADTDDHVVITDLGDLTTDVSNGVEYDASDLSWDVDDDELIEAIEPALAIDNAQLKEVNTGYRFGEEVNHPITVENYLSRPGYPVSTSETTLGLPE